MTGELLRTAWVVWSYEHAAWWGPNHHGYHEGLLLAGVYDETEARAIEAKANRYRPADAPNERALSLAVALREAADDQWMAFGVTVLRVLAQLEQLETAPPDPAT